MPRRPELTVSLILSWADAHIGRAGQWPKTTTGSIVGGPLGENWRRIDNALRYGLRGLPGGSSLAQLLDRHRGVRNVQDLPALTEDRTLQWADHHHRRTGAWPTHESGPILAAPGEVWRNVDQALRSSRGFVLVPLANGSPWTFLLVADPSARDAVLVADGDRSTSRSSETSWRCPSGPLTPWRCGPGGCRCVPAGTELVGAQLLARPALV